MLQRSWLERVGLSLGMAILGTIFPFPFATQAQTSPESAEVTAPTPDAVVACELLIIGGGLAGTAAAYHSLKAGHTVCLTELTDWVGGQISSQGTSALDEYPRQRQLLFYAAGYKGLRDRIAATYDGEINPGKCWVSATCFMPEDAHQILLAMLQDAAREGEGELKWFPNTVPKHVELNPEGSQITSAVGIQHSPATGTPPLNTEPLSQIIEDAYRYEDSARLDKQIIQFVPAATEATGPTDWYVIEATETGEVIAMAGVPYRLGLDPVSQLNPSSPVTSNDAYCTQGFTYTFAMEATAEPQPHDPPEFYPEYEPYFSYERSRDGYSPQDYYDFVFTYRRIWSANPRRTERIIGAHRPQVGDISMQNWTWGNDYRPGTAADNLIYTHGQLLETGQLEPGGWLGGLRQQALARGEENALSYYYWLAIGTTDSQLGDDVKEPFPNSRFLKGYESPMGTAHGLSKHPYMREGRRIVGRPAYGYSDGFEINEVDFTRIDFSDPFYANNLGPNLFMLLRREVAGQVIDAVLNDTPAAEIPQRQRSRIYPDSVGIANYTIDFHPCMLESPPEAPGNIERPGVRQAHGPSYPTQIPLRSLIPQRVDNLLVAGKSIATSTIAAAAYRVHSFEWSVGVGAAATIDFALRQGVLPYELVDDLPSQEPLLDQLRLELEGAGNPTQFPNTTRTNEDWDDWSPGW